MATLRLLSLSTWLAKLKDLVPAEWATWYQVVRVMETFRSPQSSERRLNRLWAVYQFALGAVPGALCTNSALQLSEGAVAAVFGGILAFSGVLAGFLVTLMLFAGRLGTTQSLSLEDMRDYGSRLRYLLVSQAVTLAYVMSMAVLSVCYLIFALAGAPILVHSTLLALLGGCFASGVGRSVLLPIQIFELHDAYLLDELAAKSNDTNSRYS